MSDPRISDQELAAINAAAVTKEYRVKPHIGQLVHSPFTTALVWTQLPYSLGTDYRTVSAINGQVISLPLYQSGK
jgi:V-type H+-transporting ATPase subunit B